jgi:dihydropyrimidine dehydrogenase (NAD+) subunit PreT
MVASPFTEKLGRDRAEKNVAPSERAWSEVEARIEAARCLYCHDAPCTKGCPATVDVAEFVRSIRTGAFKAAARLILAANVLGETCGSVCPTELLCAGECVLSLVDGQRPIAINRLQRFAVNWARTNNVALFERAAPTGKKIALVGAGPASVACAHELALHGHETVLFESASFPGGLNTRAIAPHKMHADLPLAELDWLLRAGVEIRTGVRAGRDITFEQIEREYDAFFLGAGLGPDRMPGIPGEDSPGVIGAIALLAGLKTGTIPTPLPWKSVLCVGGGNSAFDAARTLVELGVPDVTLVYRRTEDRLKGYRHEWEEAKLLGVKAVFETLPQEVLVAGGSVTGLRCIRMTAGEPDESGRPAPVPLPGTDHEIGCDAVILALGQAGPRETLPGLPADIAFDGNRIAVSPESGATNRPGWFAGGDCANGGKEVVNAAAEGKRAARAIDRYLAGKGVARG